MNVARAPAEPSVMGCGAGDRVTRKRNLHVARFFPLMSPTTEGPGVETR